MARKIEYSSKCFSVIRFSPTTEKKQSSIILIRRWFAGIDRRDFSSAQQRLCLDSRLRISRNDKRGIPPSLWFRRPLRSEMRLQISRCTMDRKKDKDRAVFKPDYKSRQPGIKQKRNNWTSNRSPIEHKGMRSLTSQK